MLRKGYLVRQLGMKYMQENTANVIIIRRLVELQQFFGGEILSFAVAKHGNVSGWVGVHVTNLIETYGASTVNAAYQSIYGKVG